MLKGARTLVVVPARGGGGSLRPLAGRPLVSRVGDVVAELDWVDRAVVSTDQPAIAEAARDSGLEAPFMHAGEPAGELEVLAHALEATEGDDGSRYDAVVMLEPTSPMRRAGQVTETLAKLLDEDLDAVWTVSPTGARGHPLNQLVLDDQGALRLWDERGAGIGSPAELPAVYHRNGLACALRRSCVLEQGPFPGRRTGAVVIDEPIVNVDTEQDFDRAEALLAAGDGPAGAPAPAPVTPKSLVVDIDGVIAEAVSDRDYARAGPLRENIARVNALYDAGCRITLHTARGSATGRDWSRLTREQLSAWGVRYHELRVGKPPADYYVDDRQITLPQAVALCGVSDPASANRE